MKKSILGGLAAGAVALSLAVAGPAHANQDEICGPGGCFDHLGSGVCHLIKLPRHGDPGRYASH